MESAAAGSRISLLHQSHVDYTMGMTCGLQHKCEIHKQEEQIRVIQVEVAGSLELVEEVGLLELVEVAG